MNGSSQHCAQNRIASVLHAVPLIGACRPAAITYSFRYSCAGLENGTCREEDIEKAKALVPPSLAHYIDRKSRK